MHGLIITWQTLYGDVTSPDGRQKEEYNKLLL